MISGLFSCAHGLTDQVFFRLPLPAWRRWSRSMPTLKERLQRHLERVPDVARAQWVAPNATLVGDVTLGAKSSVFYGAVLRGDIARIIVGEGTNIQDNAVVH